MPTTDLPPLAIAALALLFERPVHPYEASQLLDQRRRGRVVKISAGSLYRTIERLVEDGLARVVGTEREGNRPERTIYAITDEGRQALRDSIEAMVSEPRPGFPVLPFALSELHNLSPERSAEMLERRLVAQREALAAARVFASDAEAYGVPAPYVIDVEFQISALDHEIAWIESLISRLRSGELSWDFGTDLPPHRARTITDPKQEEALT